MSKAQRIWDKFNKTKKHFLMENVQYYHDFSVDQYGKRDLVVSGELPPLNKKR